VVVGAPRAEPAILLRDFLEPTRRSSPRFTDRQFHELLQDMVHLDQTIAVRIVLCPPPGSPSTLSTGACCRRLLTQGRRTRCRW
jgi:hypothetical protein